MIHRTTSLLAGLALALALARAAAAQAPLTLEQALARAERDGYANRVAAAQAAAESARPLGALRGVLPSVRVEAGWARTTDPIGAFGTTLRQRAVTQADFDPGRLNDPSAIGNYAGAVVVEQPVFNADAHLGRSVATRVVEAAEASAEWTRSSTRLDVVRAYYGAMLAAESVATLEAALRAAAGHVRQAESMVASGVATRSDALLARVKEGEVEAQLVSARGDAVLAVRQLALLMGSPEDTTIAVPSWLPAADEVRGLASDVATPGSERADVRAAKLGWSAARTDVTRARSLYLPRVNAFARLEWNSAARLYGGRENWTAGVMASWSPFAGASEIAELRAASGRAEAARAGSEAAEAKARLEIEQAETARRVALARLEIAERATRQSAEAHRIVARKYDGGLATVVELLDAAAAETASGLAQSKAIHDAVVAEAEWRLASGRDVTGLTVLRHEKAETER
jgi:outer membrane protein TolC